MHISYRHVGLWFYEYNNTIRLQYNNRIQLNRKGSYARARQVANRLKQSGHATEESIYTQEDTMAHYTALLQEHKEEVSKPSPWRLTTWWSWYVMSLVSLIIHLVSDMLTFVMSVQLGWSQLITHLPWPLYRAIYWQVGATPYLVPWQC